MGGFWELVASALTQLFPVDLSLVLLCVRGKKISIWFFPTSETFQTPAYHPPGLQAQGLASQSVRLKCNNVVLFSLYLFLAMDSVTVFH